MSIPSNASNHQQDESITSDARELQRRHEENGVHTPDTSDLNDGTAPSSEPGAQLYPTFVLTSEVIDDFVNHTFTAQEFQRRAEAAAVVISGIKRELELLSLYLEIKSLIYDKDSCSSLDEQSKILTEEVISVLGIDADDPLLKMIQTTRMSVPSNVTHHNHQQNSNKGLGEQELRKPREEGIVPLSEQKSDVQILLSFCRHYKHDQCHGLKRTLEVEIESLKRRLTYPNKYFSNEISVPSNAHNHQLGESITSDAQELRKRREEDGVLFSRINRELEFLRLYLEIKSLYYDKDSYSSHDKASEQVIDFIKEVISLLGIDADDPLLKMIQTTRMSVPSNVIPHNHQQDNNKGLGAQELRRCQEKEADQLRKQKIGIRLLRSYFSVRSRNHVIVPDSKLDVQLKREIAGFHEVIGCLHSNNRDPISDAFIIAKVPEPSAVLPRHQPKVKSLRELAGLRNEDSDDDDDIYPRKRRLISLDDVF